MTQTPDPPRMRRLNPLLRLLGWLFTVIVAAGLSLVAAGAALLWLGYTPQTPADLAGARAEVATLQAEKRALETRVADVSRQAETSGETIDEVRGQLGALNQTRAELETAAREQATLAAELRTGRDQLQQLATADVQRSAQLQALEDRSDRVERFLSRLSDIAADTAIDLGGRTPVAQPAPQAPTPTIAPAATVAPETAASPTATDRAGTSPTATSTSVATPTATSPTATDTSGPSPTATKAP